MTGGVFRFTGAMPVDNQTPCRYVVVMADAARDTQATGGDYHDSGYLPAEGHSADEYCLCDHTPPRWCPMHWQWGSAA